MSSDTEIFVRLDRKGEIWMDIFIEKKFLHEVQYYELYNKEGNIHFITGISKINTNHLSTYQIE